MYYISNNICAPLYWYANVAHQMFAYPPMQSRGGVPPPKDSPAGHTIYRGIALITLTKANATARNGLELR